MNHRERWLHCHHLEVGRLIGACASADIEHGLRLAQSRPDRRSNPGVWLTCGPIAMANLVVYCLHRLVSYYPEILFPAMAGATVGGRRNARRLSAATPLFRVGRAIPRRP